MISFPKAPAATCRWLDHDWPAHFGDPTAEYDAMVTDRVLMPVPCGRVVRAEGPDAASFLQGMVSQNIHAIPAGDSAESWLLDANGRTQTLVRIYRAADQAYLILPPAGMAELVLNRLDHYHIMEDLRLGIDASLAVVTVQGPNHVGFHEGNEDLLEPLWDFPNDRCGYGGYDLIGSRKDLQKAVDTLFENGIGPAGMEAWHMARIEAFKPLFGIDMQVGVNPVIYGAKGRISGTKGCYIGQETVAMTRDRGRPPRVMVWLAAEGSNVPDPGSWLYAGEEQAVEISSAVLGPKSNQPLAIGLVKFSHLESGSLQDETGQSWQIRQHTYEN